MPGRTDSQRGRPVGLDRAHHLEPGRRLRRRLQQRHLAQPGRPGRRQPPVHGRHRAVPGELHGGDRRPGRDAGRARRRGHLGRGGGRLGAGRRRHHGRQRGHLRPTPSTSRSTWHDGQPITLADAFYSIAQGFDLAYDPDKARVEVALAATSRPVPRDDQGLPPQRRRHGRRCTSTTGTSTRTRSPAYASPTSFAMPWEVLAAMDDLVFDQRRAAYRDTAASRQNVPWLSLVHDAATRGWWTARCAQLAAQEDDPRGLLPGGRPVAGHRGRGGRALPGGPGLVRRSTATRHQQRPVPPGRATTRRRSSRSWTRSATRAIRSRPPTSSWASRPRCPSTPPDVDPRRHRARTHRSRSPSRDPGTLALHYLLIDPATGRW